MSDTEKKRQEDEAAKAVSRAKTRMVMGKGGRADAFFATPVMSLRYAPDWSIPTAATDGKTIFYNPETWLAWSPAEQLGVLAHEAFHVLLKHHCRLGSRDVDRANNAMDLAINVILKRNGYTLPKGAWVAGEGRWAHIPTDKGWEHIYNLLPAAKDKAPGAGQAGAGAKGGKDEGGCGSVMKPGDGSPAAVQEAEGEAEQLATMAKYIAQQKGKVPADIERSLGADVEVRTNWKDELAEFVTQKVKNDYSWSRPSRRFLSVGLCLPGLDGDELGDIVLLMDTSGSIGRDVLSRFAANVRAIVEAYKVRLTVLWHDSEVAGVQEWEPCDGELELVPRGGGGTDHRPCFEWIEEHALQPACVVAFTDLVSSFPDSPPDYPVLWAYVGQHGARVEPGFGRKLRVDPRGM